MDRKSIFILIFSIAGLIFWFPLVNKLYPPQPPSTEQGLGREDSTVGVGTTPTSTPGPEESGQVPGVEASTTTQITSNAPSIRAVNNPTIPNPVETLLNWENEKVTYAFTSLGGGIKSFTLKEYEQAMSQEESPSPDTVQAPKVTLNAEAAAPAMSIFFGKLNDAPLSYELSQEGSVIQARYIGPDGIFPFDITKTFEPGSNYVVRTSIQIRNKSDAALDLPPHYVVTGTGTPGRPEDTGMHMGLIYQAGEDIEEIKENWFANRTLGCFPGTPRSIHNSQPGRVPWTAVHNQFFTMIAIPDEPAPGLIAQQITLQPPSPEMLQIHPKANQAPKGYQSALSYPSRVLQPGEKVFLDYQLFTGPREYNTLVELSQRTQQEVDTVMGFDGFFGFFAKALLISMNKLNQWGLSYGWAIVAITVIVKLLFWPLTQASTRSMKRMSALQPEMKALQEKYKEDPQKMNRKLMEFMREKKCSPLGGCLPILLQLPVFFGFYTMLQSAIELRGASFLWTPDLSQPDTLFIIPGLEIPFNLWPILMGAAQLWQTSMTPTSPGMDPTQQKIMKYMPLMFVFILYNFSAGLALYWTVQNILSIVQMKLIRNEQTVPTPGSAAIAQAKTTPHVGGPDWGQSYRKTKKKK
ncbi:MAG: membrane protein insertase YidC [Verrucomicrobiota bacterium]|nr:membrane protein insertase YidC [Verrucomicrobiota bacterium]